MAAHGKFLQDKRLWAVTFGVFALLVLFFDRSNLIEQWKIRGSIRELEEQKRYYEERIESDSLMMLRLEDDYYLEKFAREQYKMKRKGEIIYVIR